MELKKELFLYFVKNHSLIKEVEVMIEKLHY